MHCWRVLLAAWEPASAVEAGQTLAAGKLFKDTSEAGFGAEGAEADEPDNTAERAVPGPPPSQRKRSTCSTSTGTASTPSRAARPRRRSRAAASRVARSERVSVSIAVCGA